MRGINIYGGTCHSSFIGLAIAPDYRAEEGRCLDLAPIIKQAENFLQSFYRNLYDYHRANKPSMPLNQAFESAGIFNIETLTLLRDAVNSDPDADHLRRLFRFVATWFIRYNLLPCDQELARHYDLLSWPNVWAEHDALSPGQPPPPRPEAPLLAQLAAIYEQRWQELNEQVARIGFTSPIDFYAWSAGIDLAALQQAAQATLTETAEAYFAALATVKPPVEDRWQLEAYLCGETYDSHFPAAELVPVVEDTLYHLGLDITRQPNLVLEVSHELPAGFSLAFPVRVPEEIYVCVSPKAGINAFENILGLGGMVMARLLRDPKQSWYDRRLFDPALDAAYAEIFTRLVTLPAWRGDLLGEKNTCSELQAFTQLRQLYRLRLAAARVTFAINRGQGQNQGAALLTQALGVNHDPSAQVLDMGHMRSAFDTFRGMQAGAQLATKLVNTYGPSWYRNADCGQALRQLFQQGLSHLDELVTLCDLDM